MALGITTVMHVLALALLAQQTPNTNTGPDVVKARFTIKGKFVAFEAGDYIHAVINVKGKEESYFIKGAGMEYYLATHVGQTGTFTIERVDSYIENAGQRMTIETLTQAKIGKQGNAAWWKAQTRRTPEEQVRAKYDPLVEKLSRKS